MVGVAGLRAGAAEQKPANRKPEQKTMSGTWEMSNSERDQLCNLTFKPEAAKGGFRLEFDPACGDAIPPLKEVEAWILDQRRRCA